MGRSPAFLHDLFDCILSHQAPRVAKVIKMHTCAGIAQQWDESQCQRQEAADVRRLCGGSGAALAFSETAFSFLMV